MTPGANDLRVFAIKTGELNERLDVYYWQHEFRELEKKLDACKFDVVPLEELIIEPHGVKDGPGGWLINKSEYVDDGIPMLRGLNILDGRVDLKNVVYITPQKHQQLSSSEALPGDILITMRGTFGRAAILPDTIPKANMNAALCRIRLKDPALSEYLMWYLNSEIAYSQFKRHGTKAVQDDLNLGYIKALRVIIPDVDNRNRLLNMLVKANEDRFNGLQHARKLLERHNIFTSQCAGITNTKKQRLCFAIQRKNLDGVISANRYSTIKLDSHSLKVADICSIVEDRITASKLGSETVDWIRIDDLPNQPLDIDSVRTVSAKEIEGTFFEVKKGDILVARLGPTILNQKIVMVRSTARRTIASPEFLVLRCQGKYNPEAVMAVLKTTYYRDLMYSHARGSTPSRYRLNREDMLNLDFPDISLCQEKIAEDSISVKEQVKLIRIQSETNWLKAKAQFNTELLG